MLALYQWTQFSEVLMQPRNLMQKIILSFPQSKHKHLNLANRCEKLSRAQAVLSVPKLFEQLTFHLWTKCLSGNPVKHWNWSGGDQYSPSSHSDWCWPTQGTDTSALVRALQVSTCEIKSPLLEPHHSLTTSSRNKLLFVGVYITAGWESPAMGNQCILPAICCFHLLIHKFLTKFHPIPLPHFYLRVIGWTWWEAMHR